MKKLFICLVILMATATLKTFAATYYYNCSNPTTVPLTTTADEPGYPYFFGATGNKCGYTSINTTGENVCNKYPTNYQPGDGNTYVLEFCNYSASINSGLIFLIIAGVGAGSFMFNRKLKLKAV